MRVLVMEFVLYTEVDGHYIFSHMPILKLGSLLLELRLVAFGVLMIFVDQSHLSTCYYPLVTIGSMAYGDNLTHCKR